jgi:hypothetical protein
MNGEAILTVSAAVVGLVSLVKWAGLPARVAPLAVLVAAAIGVGVWGWSAETFARTTAFEFFAGWVAVSMAAAGIFGFTRATGAEVTALQK